jgi:hypothetical protein
MFALAFVASFLFTPSLASLSIVGRLTSCPGGSSDQSNFALLAVSEVHNVFQARMTLALGSDGSSGSSGWLGVSSLPLSATIVLICHMFCRTQTL